MFFRRKFSSQLMILWPTATVSGVHIPEHTMSLDGSDGILWKRIKVNGSDIWYDFLPIYVGDIAKLEVEIYYQNCSDKILSVTILDKCPAHFRIVDGYAPLVDINNPQRVADITDLITTGLTVRDCHPCDIIRIVYTAKSRIFKF